jgi:hypothetical protein
MDRSSTFALLGFPETLSTAVTLILLSLSLAPWLGGIELGPLKVPKLPAGANRWVRLIAPAGLLVFCFGYLKLWPINSPKTAPLTYSQYVDGFFNTSKGQAVHGKLYRINELEMRYLRQILGGTRWDGGKNWGTVSFDETGRIGTYTNEPGRSPGTMLVQGVPMGSLPILVGEWQQEDGQAGRAMMEIPHGGKDERLDVLWGPSFTVRSEWKKHD